MAKSQVVEVRSLIHEMIRLGIIEKQQMAYINPFVVVEKKRQFSQNICGCEAFKPEDRTQLRAYRILMLLNYDKKMGIS